MSYWHYTLTEIEQVLARMVAARRHAAARTAGLVDAKIGPQSTTATDLEGFAAELAFCKLMNVYPDLQIGQRKDYDAVVGTRTVDVKTTTRATGRLLVKPSKAEHPAQWYALLTGTFPGPYSLRGMAHRDTLLVPARRIDVGHGTTYGMTQDALLDPVTFWAEAYDER